MNLDVVVRSVAALAAVGVVASPLIVAVVRKAQAVWQSHRVEAGKEAAAPTVGIAEQRAVLELANRLRLAGCSEGVSLCQQLLDVLLTGCPKVKK